MRASVVSCLSLALFVGCEETPRVSAVAAAPVLAESSARNLLPRELAEALSLDDYLTTPYFREHPESECRTRLDDKHGELRREIQLRLPDGRAAVVFLRAGSSDSLLHHVEVIRVQPGREQLGMKWDSGTDESVVARWTQPGAPREGLVYTPSTLGRALRYVGKRVLRTQCPTKSSGGS